MNSDKLRRIAVPVSIVLMIALNYLSNTGAFGGQTNGSISAKYNTLITPAGYAFAIWGIIFLGLLAYGIYQALPSQARNPRFRAVGWWVVLNAVCNGIWSPIFNNELIGLALLVILVMLGSLGVIAERLLSRPRLVALANKLDVPLTEFPVSVAETWLARVPFLIYFGWLTVATILNITIALKASGFDMATVAEPTWAAGVLVVGTVVGAFVFGRIRSVAYILVFAWAYVAIARKQPDSTVQMVAYAGAVVAVGLAASALLTRNRTPVYA
jgi:translocator protein